MPLTAGLHWVFSGDETHHVDPALLQLLGSIQQEGSLQRSAKINGLSYRHAWGMIKKWEIRFDSPLVSYARGRGSRTRLTEFGEKFADANRYLDERIRPDLLEISSELNESLAAYLNPDNRTRIKVFASHDLAVAHLLELLGENTRFSLDFQTRGSLDALQGLFNGQCQIAGFHLPLQPLHQRILPEYLRWLSAARHELITVVIREQGILCKRGNPKNIQTMNDLSKRSVRFINRQKHSGTRTIFDELLNHAGIDPGQINGYNNEEFTHVAVAAMISSGAADAGFGIKAVTRQFNLDFIPHLQEIYLLAIDKNLGKGIMNDLKALLQSDRFRKTSGQYPGIDSSQSGTPYRLEGLSD